jgi:hypothetical protein
LFLDQKFKIYMGGAKFLKGGDIPRRFAPLGAIFRYSDKTVAK